MGQEIRCMVTFGDNASDGTAHLDGEALRFRGPLRLTIPLREVQAAIARDGRLEITTAQGVATFDLGRSAERWAAKILHPPSVLDKLGVKDGSRVCVLSSGAPGEGTDAPWGLREHLIMHGSEVGEDVLSGGWDTIFLGAENREDLGRIDGLRCHLEPAGAVWVVFPKGKQHLKEADVLASGRAAGLVDVKVVKFSETHTALKFVVPVAHRAQRPR